MPPTLWTVRQQIMTTADQAVEVAERWGARVLVPYADGGAPWFWQIGLGANLAEEKTGETAGFDPAPERVLAALAGRTLGHDGVPLASRVQPLLLRPGDSVRDFAGDASILRLPGHNWPYVERLVPATV